MSGSVPNRSLVRRFRWAAVLLLAILWTTSGSANPSNRLALDLFGAIDLALQQNRALGQQNLANQAGRIDILQAEEAQRLQLEPRVAVGRGDQGGDNQLGLGMEKQYLNGIEINGVLNQGDRLGWQMEINRALFSDQARRVAEEPLAQSRTRSQLLGHQLDERRQKLISDVVESYRTLRRLEAQQRFNQAAIKRLEKLVAASRARERFGRTTRVDTLRTEMQLGTAVNQSRLDDESVIQTGRRLALLLGQSTHVRFVLAPLPDFNYQPPSPVNSIQTAMENRGDYASSQIEMEAALRGVRLAESLLKPAVKLFGQLQQNPSGLNADDGDARWFIGLRSDGPFSRRRKGFAFAKANLERLQAEQRMSDLRAVIRDEVLSALANYRQTRDSLVIAEQNLVFARDRLGAATKLFELGRESQLSVALAESDFLSAQIQGVVARSDVSIAIVRIHGAQGTLEQFAAASADQQLAGTDANRRPSL